MSKKKKRVYSLQDYIAGVSYEEFEKQNSKISSRDPTDPLQFNLASRLEKVWRENYREEFASKHYLYYQYLDNCALQAQNGDADAIEQILAFTLHSYQPHAMIEKYPAWHSIGEDDFCQIICSAVLDAIARYTFEASKFNNFAGFVKSLVVSKLKESQITSSPIIQKKKKDRDENPISYVMIESAMQDEECGFDIRDNFDSYTDLEGNKFFIEDLKKLPDKIGDVMVVYYGLDNPLCKGRTLKETAEIVGMSVKAVRIRLEKGKEIIRRMYPQYANLSKDNEPAA